jgi:hypothetical protein
MKVMTTERSRLPPNITVQMLEAPPPGLQPEFSSTFTGFYTVENMPPYPSEAGENIT